MLIRFFRTSFASQYIAAGLTGIVLWGLVLPNPPGMPAPEGPVLLYKPVFDLLHGFPVIASLAGLLLMIICAFWLNSLMTSHEIVPKNSSLVVFLYIVFSCWHPLQMTLTPVGIAIPFFLSVLQSLLRTYNRTEPVDLTFSAAFMISVASMFYLPFILLYGFLLTSFLVYRAVHWREWASSLIGLLTPFMFMMVYAFLTDQAPEMASGYDAFLKSLSFQNPWTVPDRILPALFLLFLLLAGVIHNFSHLSERTIEIRKKLILMNWSVFWILLTVPAAGSLLIYLPGLAVITIVPLFSNLCLSRKKTLFWNGVILAFLAGVAVNQILNLLT